MTDRSEPAANGCACGTPATPPPPPPAVPPPAAAASVTCNAQEGDGSGGTEEYLTNTPTMQACAEYVAQNRPGANAATWGRTNQKCYAESSQTGVSHSTEWMNCYVTPPAASLTCNAQEGDGSGGTEEYLTNTPTMQACAE